MRKQSYYISLAAALLAIAYYFIISFYITPSFKAITLESAERNALMVGHHMKSMISGNHEPMHQLEALPAQMEKWRKELNLEKIKLFTKDGVVVYSTNKEDIGKKNTHDYFTTIVSRGKTFSTIVSKDRKTMEGRIVQADVVETYVPFMKEGEFQGAVELYFDITSLNKKMSKAVNISTLLPLLLILVFFMLVLVLVFPRANDSSAEKALPGQHRSPYLFLFIILLAIFVCEVVVMAMLTKLPPTSVLVEALIDASLLALLVAPFLFLFICKPLLQHIEKHKVNNLERERTIKELNIALDEVKTLSGLLPICSWCKKIRDDKGYWSQIERYVSKHSEANFSHSVCPDCMEKHYPEVTDSSEENKKTS